MRKDQGNPKPGSNPGLSNVGHDSYDLFPLTKGIVAFSNHLLADQIRFNIESKQINKTGVNAEYPMLNVSDLMKTTFFEDVLFHGKER